MTAVHLFTPTFIPPSSTTKGCSKCSPIIATPGWGETEVHLHHGMHEPDTAENTRRQLTEFRDQLAFRHRCLSTEDGCTAALRLRARKFCARKFRGRTFLRRRFGDADSGRNRLLCRLHAADGAVAPRADREESIRCTSVGCRSIRPRHIAKDRSRRRPRAANFSADCAGAAADRFCADRCAAGTVIENGAITGFMPMSLRRLAFWKRARVHVQGRPDWLFIKLHCHGMDPTQQDAVIGDRFPQVSRATGRAEPQRKETLHFVTAREMANILLAACDGRDGNPGDYRDYRFKRIAGLPVPDGKSGSAFTPEVSVRSR